MRAPSVGAWWLLPEKEIAYGWLVDVEVLSRGRSGDGALDGGVVGQIFFRLRQIVLTAMEDFYDEDRIVEIGTQTLDGLPEK